MIIESEFDAAWWLTNAHAQTIWPTLTRRDMSLFLRPERMQLFDGDFIDLMWAEQGLSQHAPLVVLLHGLGGNIQSAYAKGLLQSFNHYGWRGVFMHYRGCSGEPNIADRNYHSGETQDLDYLLRELRKREPETPMACVGISLGGNILLKWLGESRANAPCLEAAVAVSTPMDLRVSANHMCSGAARFYQARLLRQLQSELMYKFKDRPAPFDIARIKDWKCFWSFDDNITAPVNGFRDVHQYYNHVSSRRYLKHIQTHTLIIHAKDDPFMTPEVIPSVNELSPAVCLELSERGGHVGFIKGSVPGLAEYWLEERIPQFLSDKLH